MRRVYLSSAGIGGQQEELPLQIDKPRRTRRARDDS